MSRPVNRMRAVHPGEVLREDYLAPLGMSVNALATALGVAATRMHEILKERRARDLGAIDHFDPMSEEVGVPNQLPIDPYPSLTPAPQPATHVAASGTG